MSARDPDEHDTPSPVLLERALGLLATILAREAGAPLSSRTLLSDGRVLGLRALLVPAAEGERGERALARTLGRLHGRPGGRPRRKWARGPWSDRDAADRDAADLAVADVLADVVARLLDAPIDPDAPYDEPPYRLRVLDLVVAAGRLEADLRARHPAPIPTSGPRRGRPGPEPTP